METTCALYTQAGRRRPALQKKKRGERRAPCSVLFRPKMYSQTLPWLLSAEADLPSGRILLPSKELANLQPFFSAAPLVLLLSAGPRSVHVGVRDFGAPEGCCELPQSLIRELELDSPSALSTITLSLPTPLEAAVSLSLSPLTADFYDEIASPEAWLSSSLPTSYLALTLGQVITLRHCAKPFSLRVAAVAPAQPGSAAAVSLFSTNVALQLAAQAEEEEGPRGRAAALSAEEPLVLTLPPGTSRRFRIASVAGAEPPRVTAHAEPAATMTDCEGSVGLSFASVYLAPGAGSTPLWPSLGSHCWVTVSGAGGVVLDASHATPWGGGAVAPAASGGGGGGGGSPAAPPPPPPLLLQKATWAPFLPTARSPCA